MIIVLKVNLVINLPIFHIVLSDALVTFLLLCQINESLKKDYILSPNCLNTTG